MANPRSAKRDIEKARQLKALHKRERRQAPHGGDESEPGLPTASAAPGRARIGQDEVLERLAALHARFAEGDISFDAFEAEKSALVDQLEVE